jgi:hypothetical protein
MLHYFAIFYLKDIYSDHILTAPINIPAMDHDQIIVLSDHSWLVGKALAECWQKLPEDIQSIRQLRIMLGITAVEILVKSRDVTVYKNCCDSC